MLSLVIPAVKGHMTHVLFNLSPVVKDQLQYFVILILVAQRKKIELYMS